MSAVRESIQLAAVLGKEFNYELIRAVSPLEEVELAQHLEHLVTSEFLYQRGLPPESTYIFKHSLIQDAAYNSLLITRRQQYHQQAARSLEQIFPRIAKSSRKWWPITLPKGESMTKLQLIGGGLGSDLLAATPTKKPCTIFEGL